MFEFLLLLHFLLLHLQNLKDEELKLEQKLNEQETTTNLFKDAITEVQRNITEKQQRLDGEFEELKVCSLNPTYLVQCSGLVFI